MGNLTIDEFTQRKSEKLAEEGYRHLNEGNPEEALKVAAKLEELRFTAAFEIAALAHLHLGDTAVAVTTLERGVAIAPTVWINWQLLGNCLSDLERYDDAARAYDEALGCAGVDESSIRLNQAVLATRRGLIDEVLSYADQVTDPDLAIRVDSVRVHALARAGRLEEAIRVGEAALGKIGTEESEVVADLVAVVGRARMRHGATARQIVDLALAGLDQHDRSNHDLLALIRDADNQYSAAAKYYRMTIDVKIPFADPRYREAKGYIVHYDVVADSVDEALTFVQRMETPVVRDTFLVDEHEVLEERPGDPKGVYKRTERHYYSEED